MGPRQQVSAARRWLANRGWQRRRSTLLVAGAAPPVIIQAAAPELDIWRDTALRFVGYTNEIGEAFRNVLPKLVGPSYTIAFAYVAGDVLDKAKKSYVAEGGAGRRPTALPTATTIVWAMDCFVWQTLASVLVPGAIIHKVVEATSWGVAKAAPGKERLLGLVPASLVPVVVGLAAIPFIVEPLDHAVTVVMDATLRKAYPLLNVQGLGQGGGH
ncbi:hypothetical protein FOA52_008977 [Chlamydomonas sp. UWO 241]|nr:hypothetical protein FOA52_008977 [Chlamydomonas sp. UWO 241]